MLLLLLRFQQVAGERDFRFAQRVEGVAMVCCGYRLRFRGGFGHGGCPLGMIAIRLAAGQALRNESSAHESSAQSELRRDIGDRAVSGYGGRHRTRPI